MYVYSLNFHGQWFTQVYTREEKNLSLWNKNYKFTLEKSWQRQSIEYNRNTVQFYSCPNVIGCIMDVEAISIEWYVNCEGHWLYVTLCENLLWHNVHDQRAPTVINWSMLVVRVLFTKGLENFQNKKCALYVYVCTYIRIHSCTHALPVCIM